MNQKIIKKNYLVWMDLEMSGLDPEKNVILEMSALVTDEDLNVIAQGPEIVISQDATLFATMDDWNQKHHTASGLWDSVLESTVKSHAAEEQMLGFLGQYVKPRESPLCGNSVWQDRRFIAKHMPRLDQFLHYRLIDVSTLKELVRRWYPKDFANLPRKEEKHRALDDILESVEELKRYRTLVFKPVG